ncbi:MAG: tetratricopeptide repeat protein [Planctomycetota bacterium]|jgi:tetratricopeptide (TPR) repeat protein
MDKDPYDISLSKARAFFERAEEVAATENFDYAIELYLDGLRLSPDALEDGHAPLRQLSLIRQGRGGKKPSLIESKVRLLKGKTPLEKMLNSEYLMAKDPDHLIYAEHLMTAAVEGGYLRTGEWIAHIIFEAAKLSNKADKARFDSFILLKESYKKMKMFSNAVVACQCALQIRPKDGELADELKNLSANMAMKKGKYGTAKTFRESIKDRDAQDKLQSQNNVIKSADVKVEAVETARKKVQNAPDSITNILELAGALFALTTTQADEEGVKLLDNSYAKTKNFTFLKRLGEFRISRIKQQIRNLNKELKMNPQDEALTKQFGQLQHRLDEVELDHFRKCEANYPTDLRFKYEYGRTLIKAQQFDQAIPMFQASRNDPRLKTASLDKMGLCFLLKGWHDDAVDIFHQALENCVNKDAAIAKDIRYNLARAYEESNKPDEALDLYRKLAQADFSYKDVGQRIDFLRKNGK